MSLLMVHSSESIPQSIDTLVVLGKNIGVDSKPQTIRDNPIHLSLESRIVTLATGDVWQHNPNIKIILSGGKTSGKDYPAESEAMQQYLVKRFTTIPSEAISLENKSIDTASNAAEVFRMIQRHQQYHHIGLLGVGYHLKNAAKLFERYGVPIETLIFAEDIIKERSNRYNALITKWEESDRISQEKRKEYIRKILLTVDNKGSFLHLIAKLSRR